MIRWETIIKRMILKTALLFFLLFIGIKRLWSCHAKRSAQGVAWRGRAENEFLANQVRSHDLGSKIFFITLRKFGMIIRRKHAFTQHRESEFDLLQIWRWNASCSDFVAKSRSRVRYSRNASLRCNQLYPKERCRGTKENPASSYPVAFMTPTAQGCNRARRQSSEDVSAAHLNLRFNWENFFWRHLHNEYLIPQNKSQFGCSREHFLSWTPRFAIEDHEA